MEGHNSSWRAWLYFDLFCKLSKQIPAGYQAEWASNKITRVQNIVGTRLLQLSGRFHTPHDPERDSRTAIKWNTGSDKGGMYQLLNYVAMHPNAGISLPHLQHDSCCPHWRFLSLQNWWKKQGSRTLLIHAHTQSFPSGNYQSWHKVNYSLQITGSLPTCKGVLNTHISTSDAYLHPHTKCCDNLLTSKQPTYLVATKLSRMQRNWLIMHYYGKEDCSSTVEKIVDASRGNNILNNSILVNWVMLFWKYETDNDNLYYSLLRLRFQV